MRYDNVFKLWMLFIVLILGMCASPRSHAQQGEEIFFQNPDRPAPYVPGELLVKFKAEAAEVLNQAREAGEPLSTGIESLDDLFAQFGVSSVEHIFSQTPDLEAIRARFPERARRAPPGAVIPDLSRAYKVAFDPEQDVREAVSAFQADSQVEYAEPNYIATTQQEEVDVPEEGADVQETPPEP